MRVSGRDVLVRFSGSGEPDVKNKVRDILTEAYEERFQRELSAYARGT